MKIKLITALFTTGLCFSIQLHAQPTIGQQESSHYESQNKNNQDSMHATGKGYGESNSVSASETEVNQEAWQGIVEGLKFSTGKAKTATATSRQTITYHGGPVMIGNPNPTNIYYIWYGDWGTQNPGAPEILNDFAINLKGSSYFNTNSSYILPAGKNSAIRNYTSFAGSTSVGYSKGYILSDAQVQSVVAEQINAGSLPKDSNGVYMVLTSADVKESSGFCTKYCGWHTHAAISGTDIKYAFVGDPSKQCPTGCEAQSSSPNNNPGADGMASVIVHELSEAVSDPDLNAWFDGNGAENGDKCAWNFGTVTKLSNGSYYNVTLGARQYLLQQNWVNSGNGYCALTY